MLSSLLLYTVFRAVLLLCSFIFHTCKYIHVCLHMHICIQSMHICLYVYKKHTQNIGIYVDVICSHSNNMKERCGLSHMVLNLPKAKSSVFHLQLSLEKIPQGYNDIKDTTTQTLFSKCQTMQHEPSFSFLSLFFPVFLQGPPFKPPKICLSSIEKHQI